MTVNSIKFYAASSFCATIISVSILIASERQLVKDVYPGAQKWFNYLSKKYPQSMLNRIDFVISNHYHSAPKTIFFPKESLEALNQAYQTASVEELQNEFKQEEYILLHEAAHILMHHDEKATVALYLSALALAITNGYFAISFFTNSTASLSQTIQTAWKALLSNAMIIGGVIAYIRQQEKQADGFANAIADERTINGGIDVFNSFVQQDKHLFAFLKPYISTHPTPEQRINSIHDSLATRFPTS